MKPIVARILQTDVPNANGRVYPRDVIETAIAKIPKDRMFAQFGTDQYAVDLSSIAAAVGNFMIDADGYLIGEVVPMETPKGKLLTELLNANLEHDYRMVGHGKISADGVVSEYRPMYVSILPKGQGS